MEATGARAEKPFDTNVGAATALKVVVGEGKVVRGWEEGLIGMRKGGRRVIVIPPGMRAVGNAVLCARSLSQMNV